MLDAKAFTRIPPPPVAKDMGGGFLIPERTVLPKPLRSRRVLDRQILYTEADIKALHSVQQTNQKLERQLADKMRGYFLAQQHAVLQKLRAKAKQRSYTTKAQDEEDLLDFDVEALLRSIFPTGDWLILAEDEIEPLLKEALEAQIARTALEMGLDLNLDNPRVREWLGDRTERFAKQITETTTNAIRGALQAGHEAGEGIDDIADRIQQVFTSASDWRAETIARTEILGASNQGLLESYKQADVEKKRWVTAMDDRVRPSHIEAHGQVVAIDDDFEVGDGGGPAPGQIDDPGENFNCRCITQAVLPGEEPSDEEEQVSDEEQADLEEEKSFHASTVQKVYSGPADPKLPEYVADLAKAERQQWVGVWNSVYAQCQAEGGDDCEARAFRIANSVVLHPHKMVEVRCPTCNTLLAKQVSHGEFVCYKCPREKRLVYVVEDGHFGAPQPFVSKQGQKATKPGTIVASGLAVVAHDTGRVLMLQRALLDNEDDPAAGTWEFPGGRLESDELPLDAAKREWQEEVGIALPSGDVMSSWIAPTGKYQCFIYLISKESDLQINAQGEEREVINPDDPDGDMTETVAWWVVDDLPDMAALRDEVKISDWDMLRQIAEQATEPKHKSLILAKRSVV